MGRAGVPLEALIRALRQVLSPGQIESVGNALLDQVPRMATPDAHLRSYVEDAGVAIIGAAEDARAEVGE